MKEAVVGIDIGTSKVCAMVGFIAGDGQLEILGKGIEPCSGVKKGIIADIDATSTSIRSSVDQVESSAGLKIASAYVNIAGMHVSVQNHRNSLGIAGENREITTRDVEKVSYSTSGVSIPDDKQVIDIIPRQYIIDGYDEIIDPVGMVGVTLEADVDIIAGKVTSVQNIIKSVERAGLKIEGLVLEALATGEMVLTPEEKDMGVALIDIGGGITDISVFRNKNLVFYDSLPVGGDHITNDIAIGLKISYSDAEKIKRQYELALTSLIKNDQEITVTELGDNRKKNVRISEVVEIIEARVSEIFALCRAQTDKAGVGRNLGAGVVLSGGGISYVDGAVQLCCEIFDLPVRIAVFKASGITKNEYAAAAGIVKYISTHRKKHASGNEAAVREDKPRKPEKSLLGKILGFFKSFFF